MKRLILLFLLTFITVTDYAQTYNDEDARNFIFGIFGGAGLATKHNFDVALSGGLDLNKGIGFRTGLGATIFYQQIGVVYDNEAHAERDFSGNAGMTILNKSSYIFVCPKFYHSLGREETIKFYVNAGLGFGMGGTESTHKWDQSHGNGPGNYDSVLNTTPNIKSMVLRVGFGFTEYLHLSGHWWFTVTEDFGFIPSGISTSADVTNPSRTYYSPHSMAPGIISIQIGLAHSKY